jgi:RNA polymerase sigma-70 factor (sigma-E family)
MIVAADAAAVPLTLRAAGPGGAGRSAGEAVTVMYQEHYGSLVRTAVLLVGDVATAEDVVQDSFIAVHRYWWRLRDPSRARAYLHRTVANKSRSVLRHRAVAGRRAPNPPPDLPSAEDSVLAALDHSHVRTALRGLPVRQRQVMVLRYYAGLSEAQIAATMGISKGTVKAHTARAMHSLRATLRQPPSPASRAQRS